MSNVLIRDVPAEDLEQLRAAAAAQGTSLQSYLLATVRAQAAHLRRRDALTRVAQRLEGRPPASESARSAVLDAVDAAHTARAENLADHSGRTVTTDR